MADGNHVNGNATARDSRDLYDRYPSRLGAQTYREPPPTYEDSTGYRQPVSQSQRLSRPSTRTQMSNQHPYSQQNESRSGQGQDTARSQYTTSRSQQYTSRSQQDTSRSQQDTARTHPGYIQDSQRPKSNRQRITNQPTVASGQTTNSQMRSQNTNSRLNSNSHSHDHSRPPDDTLLGLNDALRDRENSKLTGSSSTNIVSVSQQNFRSLAASENSSGQVPGQNPTPEDFRMSNVNSHLRSIIAEIEEVKTDLKQELSTRRTMETTLAATEKEKRDLNNKLASLRVKLGVANANINVGKSEIDQTRKRFQEAQIQKARLEERISASNQDLNRMKDPSNPDSNVNMKKLVNNDRKEIRKLRTELEAAHAERDGTHKTLIDKELRIKEVELQVIQAGERKDRIETDLELAISHKELEHTERKEIEIKYNELLEEKRQFDMKVEGIREKIDVTGAGMTELQRQADEYRKKEETTKAKVEKMDRQLREVLIEIEQLKSQGRGMPPRIAGSIKDHQYRMSKGGRVTDTLPAGNAVVESVAPTGGSKIVGDKTGSKLGVKSGLSNFVPQPKPKGVNTKGKGSVERLQK